MPVAVGEDDNPIEPNCCSICSILWSAAGFMAVTNNCCNAASSMESIKLAVAGLACRRI